MEAPPIITCFKCRRTAQYPATGLFVGWTEGDVEFSRHDRGWWRWMWSGRCWFACPSCMATSSMRSREAKDHIREISHYWFSQAKLLPSIEAVIIEAYAKSLTPAAAAPKREATNQQPTTTSDRCELCGTLYIAGTDAWSDIEFPDLNEKYRFCPAHELFEGSAFAVTNAELDKRAERIRAARSTRKEEPW